jgi:hypothetical protein
MRAPFLIAAVFALGVAPARGEDLSFTGYARSLDTGELLYVESHFVVDAGQAHERRVVLYRCSADSPPFARKQLEYGMERASPSFDFEDARSGFAEGFARTARGLTVFARAGARAPLRTGSINPMGTLVADAGFDNFVRSRWDSFEHGAAIKVSFLVPSLLAAVSFRLRKVDEERIDGEIATVIRLSLTGPLGWFLPDIDVSYRQRDRRLMRYRGLTNIRDAHGKLLAAQIDFPEAARNPVKVDLAALRALPLRSCGGSTQGS